MVFDNSKKFLNSYLNDKEICEILVNFGKC